MSFNPDFTTGIIFGFIAAAFYYLIDNLIYYLKEKRRK